MRSPGVPDSSSWRAVGFIDREHAREERRDRLCARICRSSATPPRRLCRRAACMRSPPRYCTRSARRGQTVQRAAERRSAGSRPADRRCARGNKRARVRRVRVRSRSRRERKNSRTSSVGRAGVERGQQRANPAGEFARAVGGEREDHERCARRTRATISVVLLPASCGASTNAPAMRFDDIPFGQFLDPVLRALDVNVGRDAIEQHFGRALAEADDDVDAAQRRQHGRAIAERRERPFGSLERTHGFIAVEADDERVALRARPRQVVHVTGVQQIEAAVGEDDHAGRRRLARRATRRRLRCR